MYVCVCVPPSLPINSKNLHLVASFKQFTIPLFFTSSKKLFYFLSFWFSFSFLCFFFFSFFFFKPTACNFSSKSFVSISMYEITSNIFLYFIFIFITSLLVKRPILFCTSIPFQRRIDDTGYNNEVDITLK